MKGFVVLRAKQQNCERANSSEDFTTNCGGATTTPKIEWHDVCKLEAGPQQVQCEHWQHETKEHMPEEHRRVGRPNAKLEQILNTLNTCLQGMPQAEIVEAETGGLW